jgi:glyoxalase family protein
VTLSVPVLGPTDDVLQRVAGMRPVRTYAYADAPEHTVHVYETGAGGPGAEIHVAVQPGVPSSRQGAGAVHHVALRCADAEYDAWAERLVDYHVPNSGPVDRYWFRSLYFREPNGILFEIATDGPGFAVDEDAATLGEKVVLAPFLEPRRDEIVANLKPID